MTRETKIQPNQKYGKWTVLEQLPNRGTQQIWLCRCDCGAQRVVPYNNLYYGYSTQCKQCSFKNRKQFSPRIKVRVNGKRMFIKEAASILGMPEGTVRTRLRNSIPLTAPKMMGRRGIHYSHNGQKYNMAGWAKLFGISRERVRQRLSRGESISEIAKVYGF